MIQLLKPKLYRVAKLYDDQSTIGLQHFVFILEQSIAGSPSGGRCESCRPDNSIKETLKVRFAETFRVSLLYNKTHVEMNYGKKV